MWHSFTCSGLSAHSVDCHYMFVKIPVNLEKHKVFVQNPQYCSFDVTQRDAIHRFCSSLCIKMKTQQNLVHK